MNIFKASLQNLEDYIVVAESWQDAFNIIADRDSSPVLYIEVLEYGVPVIGRVRLEDSDHLIIGKTYEELEAENLALQQQCEEKDATITELRAEIEGKRDAIDLALRVNDAAIAKLKKKDADLTDLQHKYDDLYATVNPLAIIKPQGKEVQVEPSPCANFSEGDQVLVSGRFFGDYASLFQGIILEVTKDYARVMITEKDSDFEDDEPNVPCEYITKA